MNRRPVASPLWWLPLLVCCCCCCSLVATTVEIPFTEFLKAYPQVEKYLVENVATDDINDNMNKARELFQHELSKTDQQKPGQLALIAALQRFVSLADVRHEEEEEQQLCNFNRYITLYYNYLASRSSEGESSLRVARIVDQFALRHALMCANFYGDQVRARYEQLSREGQVRPDFEAMLDSALQSTTSAVEPNSVVVEELVQHFQQQNAPVLGSSQGEIMLASLMRQSVSNEDPDSGHLFSACDDEQLIDEDTSEVTVDRDKYEALARLFERYIRQPCKSLVNGLRDVMEPAAFDALYLPDSRQDDFFYIVWARYKLCDTMSGQRRQKLLTSLVHASCGQASSSG